jgi:hypothetical protein
MGGSDDPSNLVDLTVDPISHRQAAIKGAKRTGEINAASGHLKRIARAYWAKIRSGEITRSKKIWISDGTIEIQHPIHLPIPIGMMKGRIKRCV